MHHAFLSVRQDADRVRGYRVANESSPIGVWTGNAKRDHAIGCRTVDTNLAGELSSVELCLSHPCGIAHPPKASGFDLVVVDFPAEFARYLCGFLAFTHLSVEDLHEVNVTEFCGKWISIAESGQSKDWNRIAAVRNCCQRTVGIASMRPLLVTMVMTGYVSR
jgi:hypothetical protein